MAAVMLEAFGRELMRPIAVTWEQCDPGCPGWIHNADTGEIEGCDACGRFHDPKGYTNAVVELEKAEKAELRKAAEQITEKLEREDEE